MCNARLMRIVLDKHALLRRLFLTFRNALVACPTIVVQRLLQFLRDSAREAVFLGQSKGRDAHADFKRDDEAEDDAKCQEGAIVLFDGAVKTCMETILGAVEMYPIPS